ncbi:MAG: tetratricopeptide repeat protein [Chloroflexi bacterium]|nr:tetratricopeptide repeat protein [Chloroflexota bacterium]
MHSTKFSTFCDKVLEIGWLLAVVITPLFFNVYSSRVFEPDKLTTLRTVALIMAAVWVIKYIEELVSGQREIGVTWRTPLVFPTLFMIIVYFLSTVLSVTPWVSFFGSYQRLQGTYTTLAYVMVFLIVLQGMRTREQLERLITVIILNSLPIALYGLIQRNKLDPLPWGGDVTRRVASNMGNAIFVAAYLIMVTPPTLARIANAFRSILTDEETSVADIPRAAAYIFILLVQLIATFYTQSRGPLMGLLASLGVWGFLGLLTLQQAARQKQPFHRQELSKDLGLGLAFGVGSLVAAAATGALLYFASGAFVGPESSLPQGIAAIGAVLALLGTWLAFIVNRQGWRWLWISALVMVVFAAVGFFAVNPGGPLNDWARNQSSLRRVTNVLDSSGGTGMVRNLIWEGGVDLFIPHDPIEYPPTETYPEGHSDSFNSLRLFVGYGPESMYVAYNSFYPPLLGHFESRTASPDRSHNETLDSLIITGILGLVAYLWIFGSVFYYGLHWLGFLPSDWRRTLFFALLALGAVAATAVVVPMVGYQFFGLSIPIGMVGGLFLYMVIYAFSVYWDPEPVPEAHPYSILLIGILSAVVAHFVEINFGIAIASTRTTFWTYAGAFVVAGLGLVRERETKSLRKEGTAGNKKSTNGKRKKRRKVAPPPPAQPTLPAWLWSTLAVAIIGGFVLGTLSFDFVTNAERITSPLEIVWRAITILPNRNAPDAARNACLVRWDPIKEECQSYGALLIFGLTWIMSAVIVISEMAKSGAFRERKGDGTLATVLYMTISLTVGFGFALTLAGRQAALMNIQAQTMDDVLGIASSVAGFLTSYYGFIIFVLLGGGFMLFLGVQRQPRQTVHPWSLIALLVLMVLVSAIVVETNLQPIQADIIYKQADPYDRQKQWQVAVEHYKRAIELVPKEDFYYLYLGRAYLEWASSLNDPVARDNILRETEQTLVKAREINPLNTDHSANLARMYRRWSDFAQGEQEVRSERLLESSENYEIATMLSPQNAILWNEWAMLHIYGLGDQAGYERTLQQSLDIDDEFEQTWLMCGDVNSQQSNLEEAIICYEKALELKPRNAQVWIAMGNAYRQAEQMEKAVDAYKEALELKPRSVQYWRVLADTYIATQEWDDAIQALNQVVEIKPNANDIWNIHQVLAQLYFQTGQLDQALVHAQTALESAPEDQQNAVQTLVMQIQATMETPQP